MKPFLIWLVIFVLGFGTATATQHWVKTNEPDRITIIVDASYPMSTKWDNVKDAVNKISNKNYTLYALFTEKGIVHNWKDKPVIGQTKAYGPRDFTSIAKIDNFIDKNNNTVYFITDDSGVSNNIPSNWTVIKIK